MEHSPKPLAGLKVVELGTLIAGPFASRICAEFGAEVIKIESPDGGDPREVRRFNGGQGSLNVPCWAPDGAAFA